MTLEKKHDTGKRLKKEGGQRTRNLLKQGISDKPLISIITVVFNGAATLEDTILSVLNQTYDNIEYIIIDGDSNDDTLEIIHNYDKQLDLWLSEEDGGIYDAMNKGIELASGDYIGILNSDDFFANFHVIEKVAERLVVEKLDAVFSNLDIVDPENPLRILRKYRVNSFDSFMMRIGVMPAHPTFYCRRSCYQKLGSAPYRTDFKIASDFELLLRLLLTQKISWGFIAETTVIMRAGGASSGSLNSRLLLNREIIRACKDNNIYTNIFLLMFKIPLRLLEFIR